MKKAKILHINSVFLTSKLHENLVEKLDQANFDNTIYMPMKKEKRNEIKFESSHSVINPIVFKNYHRYFYFYKQHLIYKSLKNYLNPVNFDIVHAHSLFTDGNVAYKLNEEYDIPYVVTIRGFTDIFNFFKKRPDLRYRGYEIMKKASKVFFVSEAHKNYFIKEYLTNKKFKTEIESKISLLPNGIDKKWFLESNDMPKTLDINKTINLISVGEIIPRKNHRLSIEAVNYMNENSPFSFHLTIVGKKVDKKYYQELVRLKNENVTFIEHSSINQMIELYKKNQIFILPSKYETFGLVYPEAMSQGLPIIYSENQGLHHFFPEGHVGFSVNDSVVDISEKVHLIIDNYHEMSSNSLQKFKCFNWDDISKDLVEVYTTILGGFDE